MTAAQVQCTDKLQGCHVGDSVALAGCRDETALDASLQAWLQACEPAFDSLLAHLVDQHQQRCKRCHHLPLPLLRALSCVQWLQLAAGPMTSVRLHTILSVFTLLAVISDKALVFIHPGLSSTAGVGACQYKSLILKCKTSLGGALLGVIFSCK